MTVLVKALKGNNGNRRSGYPRFARVRAVLCPVSQTGAELPAGGSQREALPMLEGPGKTTVLIGLAVGMKFIHSRGVIPRDLKPPNILLGE